MAHSDTDPTGPDFAQGVRAQAVPSSGFLAGHVDGEPVLLFRIEDKLHAVGLRTEIALKVPAFEPLARWEVEQDGDVIFVRTKLQTQTSECSPPPSHLRRIVIVGGSAASLAAAEILRHRGYDVEIAWIETEGSLPSSGCTYRTGSSAPLFRGH